MARKRKRAAAKATIGADAEQRVHLDDAGQHDETITEHKLENSPDGRTTPPGSDTGLTAYEIQRQQLMERNRARLLELGIPLAVVGLHQTVHVDEEASRPKTTAKSKPKSKSKESLPAGGTRRSSRLKEHAELQQEADEALSQGDRELAMFIIDGECPKCGKFMRKGHRQHFAACAGIVEPTEEELAEEAEKRRLCKDKKLLALSLRGLVEFTPELAKFIVIGSTGIFYPVILRDDKRTCACVDHRCRKHDCKHIRLILKQLDIEGEPKKWREAVEKHFQSQLKALADEGGGGAVKVEGGEVEGERQQKATKRRAAEKADKGETKQEQQGPVDPTREQALKFM